MAPILLSKKETIPRDDTLFDTQRITLLTVVKAIYSKDRNSIVAFQNLTDDVKISFHPILCVAIEFFNRILKLRCFSLSVCRNSVYLHIISFVVFVEHNSMPCKILVCKASAFIHFDHHTAHKHKHRHNHSLTHSLTHSQVPNQ